MEIDFEHNNDFEWIGYKNKNILNWRSSYILCKIIRQNGFFHCQHFKSQVHLLIYLFVFIVDQDGKD